MTNCLICTLSSKYKHPYKSSFTLLIQRPNRKLWLSSFNCQKFFVYKLKFLRRLHWCLCKPWKSFKPMKEHKFISLNTFSSNTECNFKYLLSLSKYEKIDQNILIFAKIVEQKLLVLLFMTFLCRFPFFSITLQHMKIKICYADLTTNI